MRKMTLGVNIHTASTPRKPLICGGKCLRLEIREFRAVFIRRCNTAIYNILADKKGFTV